MMKQRFQAVIIPVQIIENARHAQMLERNLAHDFGDFLQRARSAGECNERFAQLDHLRLALGHILRHDQLRKPVEQIARIDEKLRLYTDCLSTCIQNALRDFTHKSTFGAAVNQRVPVCTDPMTKFANRVAQGGIVSFVCAEIDRNIHDFFLRLQ